MDAATPPRDDGGRRSSASGTPPWLADVWIYPVVQVLTWAVVVARSVFVAPPPDPELVGWTAFWIGLFNVCLLSVPIATASHVAGLSFGIPRWVSTLTRSPLRSHVLCAILHPITLLAASAALQRLVRGADPGPLQFRALAIWAIAGPAVIAVAALRLRARWQRRRGAAHR